jgi:hypothetical protein
MRKYATTLGLLLILSTVIFSQNISPDAKTSIGKSSFIAELGGPGIVFSANYDTRFKQSRLGLGGRIGIGFVSAYDDYYDPTTGYYTGGEQQSAITFPVQLNYIFGKNNSPHSFEVGGGITYVTKKLNIMNFDSYGSNNEDHRTQLFGTFSFMYRRQPVNGGFSWRVGFTPLVGSGYIQAFAAASVGYNF